MSSTNYNIHIPETSLCTKRYGYIIGNIYLVACLLMLLSVSLRLWIFSSILAGIISIPICLYLLKRPAIAITVCAIINYIPFVQIFPPGYFLIFFLVCVWIIHSIFTGHKILYFDSVTLLWLGMFALTAITIPKWNSTEAGIKGILEIVFVPFVLYQIVRFSAGLNEISTLLDGFIFVFFLILLEILLGYFLGLGYGTEASSKNLAGFHSFDVGWGHSNYLSAFIVFLMFFAFGQISLRNFNYWTKVTLYIAIALSLASQFLIISRGGIITLGAGLAILFIARLISGYRISLLQWTLVVAATGIAMWKFIERLIYRFSIAKFDSSVLGRLYIWRDSLMQIKSSPFVGAGPKQYIFTDFYTLHFDPHNVFLRYGVDLGVFAIMLILVILTIPIYKNIRAVYRKMPGAKSVLVSFLPCYLVAILNSQYEIVITSYWYGMQFWLFYAIYSSMLNKVVNREIKPDLKAIKWK